MPKKMVTLSFYLHDNISYCDHIVAFKCSKVNWFGHQKTLRKERCVTSVNYCCKSISTSAQYVTLHKCFSHPSLVVYFFATPPLKLKLETAKKGKGLLIANHLDQSLWSTNQKYWTVVRSYLLHSVQRCSAF
jgi:hypothetical protein